MTPAVGVLVPLYYYIVFAGPAPIPLVRASAGIVVTLEQQRFLWSQRHWAQAHVAPMCANSPNSPQ